MITVKAVKLEELTNGELSLIASYCRECYEPVSLEDFVNRVRNRDAAVYRFEGDSVGIFVLSRGSDGLYVETVAGQNVVKHFEEIHQKVRMVAAAAGAKALYSYVARPALQRLYDRKTKARPVATLYKEKLG